MSNPLSIATKGKGFLPMLTRGRAITGRYGLTSAKIDTALGKFTQILKQYACSATIPVTASALASNPKVGKKYYAQGLELAVHGWQHQDYSELSASDQLDHMRKSQDIFRKLDIQVTGFRCPYLRWNPDTLASLGKSGFTYDSSQALAWDVVEGQETETYRHVLDFYRAESARTYLALPGLSDGLVRIPYCLPDDEALVERLHLSNGTRMAEIWLAMLERIYQTGELFTLGLHPERISFCQEALTAVLKKARSLSPNIWIARLDEIVRWYLALGQATFEIRTEGINLYHITVTAPTGAAIMVRSLSARAITQPWIQGYQTVAERGFTVESAKRPLVGLSPNTPSSVELFLRHQGYLVERSTDPQAYGYYLDRNDFTREDERALIAALEENELPLVRLSRWPEGARSALAITGDIDAITVWDYGRRIFEH